MLNAIGGGLIGWGAILLASTLVFPTDGSSIAENERTDRNTRATTALSIISTAVGAVLILVNHDWLYALAGLGAGTVVYYSVQVALTHCAWRALAAQVELERSRIDGRITIETAGRLGLWRIGMNAPPAVPIMPVEGIGDPAQALVEERARLRWALRHPRGGHTVHEV